MLKQTCLALICLSLLSTACASASSSPRSKSLADRVDEPSALVKVPEARADDILSLLAAIYPGWPEGDEGRQVVEIDINKNSDGFYEAVVVQSGLLDDSVAQLKDKLTFGYNGAWHVTEMKQYRKCYRTSMFEWTAKPCP